MPDHDDAIIAADTARSNAALDRGNGRRRTRRSTRYGAEEVRLREEMEVYSRMLVQFGLLEFKGGNLSARIGDDHMLITRRAVSKAIPGPDDVIVTSIRENDENAFVASSAMEVHRAIYQRTDARAVIHAHPSKTVTLSFFHDELIPPDENGMLYLRPRVSVVAPPTLFGWNLAAEEMADRLREESVVIQKWHGTFAKGSDLGDAFHRTRAVEFMSAHLIRIKQLQEYFGEPTPIPTEVADVIGGLPGRGLKSMK